MPPSSENSHSSRTTPPPTPSSGSDVNLALENLALENVHPEFNNVERQRLLAATDRATGGVLVDPVTWVMLWLGDTKLVNNRLLCIQENHQQNAHKAGNSFWAFCNVGSQIISWIYG